MRCPKCGHDLVRDQAHPGKVLCYGCMTRYSEDDIRQWRGGQSQPSQPRTPYNEDSAPSIRTSENKPIKKNKGLAIFSLIIAILAAAMCWIPYVNIIAAVISIVAVSVAGWSLSAIKRNEASGKPAAILALVLGVIVIIASISITVFTHAALKGWIGDATLQNNVQKVVETIFDGETTDTIAAVNALVNNEENTVDSSIGHSDTIDGTWEDMKVRVDSSDIYTLNQTTLTEFVNGTGWQIPANPDYDLTHIVSKLSKTSSITLTNDNYPGIAIYATVINATEEDKAMGDCPLAGISLRGDGKLPGLAVSGGAVFGASGDEIRQALGEPTNTDGNFLTYEVKNDSTGVTKTLTLELIDNVCRGITFQVS